jgi:hypothetical protein
MKNETKASEIKNTRNARAEIKAVTEDLQDCVHWKNANMVRGPRPRDT